MPETNTTTGPAGDQTLAEELTEPQPEKKAKSERVYLTEEEQVAAIEAALTSVPSAAVVNALWKLATAFFRSGMFKHAGSPAGCFVILKNGHELCLKPMQSMANIYVIEGKPALSSQLMQSIAESRGVKIKTLRYDDDICSLELQYRDKQPEIFTFDKADVQRAGLSQKPGAAHTKYPRAMLHWRALSEGLRMYAPGVLLQAYTFDELTDGRSADLAGFLEMKEFDGDEPPGGGNGAAKPANGKTAAVAADLEKQAQAKATPAEAVTPPPALPKDELTMIRQMTTVGQKMAALMAKTREYLIPLATQELAVTFKNDLKAGDAFLNDLVHRDEIARIVIEENRKSDICRLIIATWEVQEGH